MLTKAGIKAIMLANKGTLLSTPTNVFYAGDRQGIGTILIQDVDNVKDYLDRSLRNKLGFKIEFTSLQCRLYELEKLLKYVNSGNVDVQVVTKLAAGATTSPEHGIFNFCGSNSLGIDLEYTRSIKDSNIKITLEKYFDYLEGRNIISASATNQINSDLAATRNKTGLDFDKIVKSNFANVESPILTNLFEKDEIEDYKFTLKLKGTKNMYGRFTASYVTIQLEVIGQDASINKINDVLSKNMDTPIMFSIPIQAKNALGEMSPGFEAYYFYDLLYNSEISISDDKRNIKIVYNGNVPIENVKVEFGDGERQQVIKFNPPL